MTLTDLYQQLFGKAHIQDGTVIEMAEHGRVGGLSTGQPFKYVVPIDPTSGAVLTPTSSSNAIKVDESTAGTTYVGKAAIGSSTAGAVWQIFRMVEASSVLTITWADGNANSDNVWDNRASLSYS